MPHIHGPFPAFVMQIRYVKLPPPPRTVFGRLLYGVFGVLALAVAALVGTVLFLVLLGATAIGAIGLTLRSWWQRRQQSPNASGRTDRHSRHEAEPARKPALEGECTIIDTRR